MPTLLTLYSRDGCHLCLDMEAAVQRYADELEIELRTVDVDSQPVLQQQYGHDVPVLTHGDVVLCRHFLDIARLKQALMHD